MTRFPKVFFRFAGALLPLLILGCTFERRETEPQAAPGSPEGARASEEIGSDDYTEQTARAAVDTFRKSVAEGDLSFALARLDGGATLVDPLVGQATEAASRGEFLLELRSRHAEGLAYEMLNQDVLFTGDDAALVVSLLSVLREGEGESAEEIGRVLETVMLLRSPEGWKIRHLHRSSVPRQ